MATLVGNVNSSADKWTISADISDEIDYLQVDDEVVRVVANFHSSIYAPTGETIQPKIRAERGAGGTTAASHTSGATLTPVIPPATGGGGGGAAADITFTPNGSIAATDVQAAVQEVRDEAGAGVLLSATVDLDAADIATLSSVPVQVVAAPGAGKVIVPVSATFQFKTGAVAFTNPSDLDLLYGDPGTDGAGLVTSTIALDQLSSAVAFFWLPDGPLIGQLDCADQPLMLEANADPDGAGDGTARLQVLYYVMDLA